MTKEEYKEVRERVIELIIATDMKFHGQHLDNYKKLKNEEQDYFSEDNFNKMCGLILHAADLGHTAKTSEIAE